MKDDHKQKLGEYPPAQHHARPLEQRRGGLQLQQQLEEAWQEWISPRSRPACPWKVVSLSIPAIDLIILLMECLQVQVTSSHSHVVCPRSCWEPPQEAAASSGHRFRQWWDLHFQRIRVKNRWHVLSAALKQNNRILADLGSNIWKVDDMNSNRTSYSKNDLENDQFRDQAEPQQWPEYCVTLAPHAMACGCSWALAQDITLVVLRSPIQSSLQANQAAQPQCERPESSRIHVLIGGICSSDIHFDPTALVTRARKAWLCISRAKVCIS